MDDSFCHSGLSQGIGEKRAYSFNFIKTESRAGPFLPSFIFAYQLFMQHAALEMVDEILSTHKHIQKLNHGS